MRRALGQTRCRCGGKLLPRRPWCRRCERQPCAVRGCRKTIGRGSKTGRCATHAWEAQKRPCSAPRCCERIGRNNKSGLCKRHYDARFKRRPDQRARHAAYIRANRDEVNASRRAWAKTRPGPKCVRDGCETRCWKHGPSRKSKTGLCADCWLRYGLPALNRERQAMAKAAAAARGEG